MKKLIESIYAYIYQYNYVGRCDLGMKVYTLTEGLDDSEIGYVTSLIERIDNAKLESVDREEGVKSIGEPAEPDYDLVSFAYYPKRKSGGMCVLTRTGLRKSLRDKTVRGTKEIIHALLFDSADPDQYAVDFMESKVFSSYTDIALDEEHPVPRDVCEKQPDLLRPVDPGELTSAPLKLSEVQGPNMSVAKVSELVKAIFLAKRDKKCVYVVYRPIDLKLATKYIRAALKFLPAHIANQLSFITCCGELSLEGFSFDICGIPTSSRENIARLRETGYVVGIDATGVTGVKGEKVPFAVFLSTSDNKTLQDWLDAAPIYDACLNTLDDVNDIVMLYQNRGRETRGDDISERVDHCFETIVRMARMANLIKSIDDIERIKYIRSLSDDLEGICADMRSVSAQRVYDKLFMPLTRLIKEFPLSAFPEVNDSLKKSVYCILFGVKGQSAEAERVHFDFLSHKSSDILRESEECGLSIIEYLKTEWEFCGAFFKDYFSDAKYSEYACDIGKTVLKKLPCDVGNGSAAFSKVRDFFVENILSIQPNGLSDILRLAFEASDRAAVFQYFLVKLPEISRASAELFEDRVSSFADHIVAGGMLEEALRFFIEQFVFADESNKECVDKILKKLLDAYIVIPARRTMEELCNGLQRVQALMSEHKTAGLETFLYAEYAERVINPFWEEAIAQVRFEVLSEEEVDRYRELWQVYRKGELVTKADPAFCERLEKLFQNYEVYNRQEQREQELVDFRIDFIIREFILLDAGTILKILKEFVGEQQLSQYLYHEGLGTKPEKDERFLEVSEKIARELLTEKGAELSKEEQKNLNAKKIRFAEKVRRIHNTRHRASLIRNISDGTRGLIGSSILTAVMVLLAAVAGVLLYHFYDGQYFRSVYFMFAVLTGIVCEMMYWYNYSDRRLHNVEVRVTWQTIIIMIVMIGLYVLAQFILSFLF